MIMTSPGTGRVIAVCPPQPHAHAAAACCDVGVSGLAPVSPRVRCIFAGFPRPVVVGCCCALAARRRRQQVSIRASLLGSVAFECALWCVALAAPSQVHILTDISGANVSARSSCVCAPDVILPPGPWRLLPFVAGGWLRDAPRAYV